MKQKDLQGTQVHNFWIRGQVTAATPDEFVLGKMPWNGQIIAAWFAPEAAITGQATNYFTLNVRNRTSAGAGAVNMAGLAFSTAPIAVVAFQAIAITLNATLANTQYATNDQLTLEKVVTGTGLALPAGVLTLFIQGR